jgi:hypothetical protein
MGLLAQTLWAGWAASWWAPLFILSKSSRHGTHGTKPHRGQKDRRRQVFGFINKEWANFVGLQETIKEEFIKKELKQLGGSNDFVWNWLSARGHSRGIL